MLAQAAELGYSFLVGPEVEFFLFAETPGEGAPTPLDDGAYFDLTSHDTGSDFRRSTIEYLEQMGIPVKASHHEAAASQHEMDLQHTDALSMADALITFRAAVKEAARERGCTPRSCRSRWSRPPARGCTCTARCSRAIATCSSRARRTSRCRPRASRSWPACWPTPPRSAP